MASTAVSSNLKKANRFNRFDNPWFNPSLIIGASMILLILLGSFVGRATWNTDLAFVGSAPLKLPPGGVSRTTIRGTTEGTWEHPLGTDGDGRDLLAPIIVGAPRTRAIGVIAATTGMLIGIILGLPLIHIGRCRRAYPL